MNFINKKTNKRKVLNLVLKLDRRWRAKNSTKLSSELLVHGMGAKLESNWEQNMLYKKSYQIFYMKMMFMLTGLKVSSLAYKSVFYKPEHNTKWGGTPWN